MCEEVALSNVDGQEAGKVEWDDSVKVKVVVKRGWQKLLKVPSDNRPHQHRPTEMGEYRGARENVPRREDSGRSVVSGKVRLLALNIWLEGTFSPESEDMTAIDNDA